jgi:hypothetical protein
MKELLSTKNYQDIPKQLLIDCVEKNKETGSSTFIIASISEKAPKLNVAFLGDSGNKNK